MTSALDEQGAEPRDEWTRVRRKGRRPMKSSGPVNPSRSNALTPGLKQRLSFLSASDIEKEHHRITDQWRASTCRSRLQEIVKSRPCTSHITLAICFGLGSFDPEDGSWESKRRAHVQLAAFLDIVEHLQHNNPQPIRCLFQEPIFNAADEVFIRNLGYEVVPSPGGFEQVNAATLVFGIHLYRDVYAQAIAHSLPAAFIGTPREVWEECHSSDLPDWIRLKDLDERCDKVKFPEDPGYNTFSSTTIHWGRQDDM
ncbi:hypothetical protein F4804DRAFT_336642 [Jackrogersella minutella]|nr:hypothetical protein F4804DRAFT_336642 [Jackrogersella minutella]